MLLFNLFAGNVAMRLFHGTTFRCWESIRKEGLRMGTTLAESPYFPAIVGCWEAANECIDAVVLCVDGEADRDFRRLSCNSNCCIASPAVCYVALKVIPPDRLALFDTIPYEKAAQYLASLKPEHYRRLSET